MILCDQNVREDRRVVRCLQLRVSIISSFHRVHRFHHGHRHLNLHLS